MITSPRVIRAAVALARTVPLPALRAVAVVAGQLSYYLLGERRRTVLNSMRYLRPSDSNPSQRRLARQLFRNIASASVDLMRLPSASREEIMSMATAVGLEHFDAARALGKGVVLVGGHSGPFELIPAWLAARGNDVSAIVEELEPDVMDALSRYRTATGVRLLPLSTAVAQSQAALARGGIVAIAADRSIGASRSAVDQPWGSARRSLPVGPAVFSLRARAPIVMARITRHHHASAPYLMEFDPPILPAEGSRDRTALMRRVSDRLYDFAREHPDEWFVFQPEWRDVRDEGAMS